MAEEYKEVRSFDNNEAFYNWNEEMAHKYDPDAYHTRSNFIVRWIEKKRVKYIRNMCPSSLQGNLLEVGCGAGNVLEQLDGKSLVGIDLSRFLLRKSKVRLHQSNLNLVQADAVLLPFPDQVFENLVCTEVLEHVPEPHTVLVEMNRVAMDNAILVFSFPNESLINQLKHLIEIMGLYKLFLHTKKSGGYSPPIQMMDEWHLHEFNLSVFINLSEDIFVITQIQAVPFGVLPLRYVVRCQTIHA